MVDFILGVIAGVLIYRYYATIKAVLWNSAKFAIKALFYASVGCGMVYLLISGL